MSQCKMCRVKDCKYRGLCVDGYTIYTTEHCCKSEVETAKAIVGSEQYNNFKSLIDNAVDKSESSCVQLLKNQLAHFENVALNALISQH